MKAFTIITSLALVAIVCADRDAFEKFKKLHGKKKRDHDHEEKRYAKYKLNDDIIKKHNRENHGYILGHNEFSDMSADEFKQIYLHEIIHIATPRALPVTVTFPRGPASINFQQYALPVRNQGTCGSCWAFAAAAQVETLLRKQNSKYNTYLSPQYLLDCAPNNGCVGGNTFNALEYMLVNGLKSDASYPYTGVKATCNATKPKMTQKINGHYQFFVNTAEQELANIIAKVGPVVIRMQAKPPTFQLYKSGIYNDATCNNTCASIMNHQTLVVGYGIDAASGIKYWLIKNSWGTTWGEAGYARIIRENATLKNNCNVACYVDYAY